MSEFGVSAGLAYVPTPRQTEDASTDPRAQRDENPNTAGAHDSGGTPAGRPCPGRTTAIDGTFYCEVCGNWWDTTSPCAACNATKAAVASFSDPGDGYDSAIRWHADFERGDL